MSRPAATTFGLPETGAARTAVPRCSAASRTTCDAPGEIVVESTRTFGAAPSRERRPASPSTTCWKSASPPTIVKTMSRSARSAGASTMVAPRSASGSAFARVRFHTATSCPAASRRLASAKPMRPAPIQPSRIPLSLLIWPPLACKRLQDGIRDRLGRQAPAGSAVGRGRGWRVWRGVRELARVGATAGAAGGQLGEGQEGPAPQRSLRRWRDAGSARQAGTTRITQRPGERRGGHLRTLAWGTGR